MTALIIYAVAFIVIAFVVCHDIKGRSHNKSGFIGVHFDAWSGKWRASIKIDEKTIKLGRFSSKRDASEAYKEAKRQHHTFQPHVREAISAKLV